MTLLLLIINISPLFSMEKDFTEKCFYCLEPIKKSINRGDQKISCSNNHSLHSDCFSLSVELIYNFDDLITKGHKCLSKDCNYFFPYKVVTSTLDPQQLNNLQEKIKKSGQIALDNQTSDRKISPSAYYFAYTSDFKNYNCVCPM